MAELSEAQPFSDNFLWLADMQQDIQEPLYVDRYHYSPEMLAMMAQNIGDWLIAQKMLDLETE